MSKNFAGTTEKCVGDGTEIPYITLNVKKSQAPNKRPLS